MNIESFREYCLAKKGVTEGFPFNETVLVFKVMGKMFALTDLEGEFRINLKCDPERALALRADHAAIIPGYHMSKTHWNTVIIDGSVDEALVVELIDHSYDLVARSLKKAEREQLFGAG
ncbi:MAG: MmcQ/YjbR family DNA-binding protein [Bacteroidota bacterium]